MSLDASCLSQSILNRQSLFAQRLSPFFDHQTTDIALIGCNERLAEAVRKELYAFDFPWTGLRISDLGNVTPLTKSEQLSELILYLINNNIVPVFIGITQEAFEDHFSIFEEQGVPYLPSFITSRANLQQDHDSKIYLDKLQFLCLQRHFPLNKSIYAFDHELMHLSALRNNQESYNTLLRRSNLAFFNLDCIRSSDHPGSYSKNPSGLHAEEASFLMRTIGLSERIQFLGVSDWNLGISSESAQLAAQMLWYFMDGFAVSKQERQQGKQLLTPYIVHSNLLDKNLYFYKSEISSKWWIAEHISDQDSIHADFSRLMPCTYEDYLNAVEDKISDQLLKVVY